MWHYLVLVFLSPTVLLAQTPALSNQKRVQEYNLGKGHVALEGYDPVSYFVNGPKMGKKEIASTYGGIIYHFSSTQNKAVFEKSPEKYEPAYGGWCAYAMGAKGEKVEVDPENYKLLDGKVYVFYKNFFSNTLDDWNKDENSLHKKADNNWQKIVTR